MAGDIPNSQQINNLELFKSLGLDADWLNHPIIIVRTGMINVGSLSTPTKDGKVLYPLLKMKMPNTIDDI